LPRVCRASAAPRRLSPPLSTPPARSGGAGAAPTAAQLAPYAALGVTEPEDVRRLMELVHRVREVRARAPPFADARAP